ncbi:hypothetical protein Tco_0126613 [Tanacetum coccineum]
MVYFVDDARAVGVETSLMMDFVRIALLKLEIHSLMIQTRILSIILQFFPTHLHNPSSRHIRASYVGTILITVMIVHHESRFEVRKKEQAYNEEKYSAACRYMLSITCDDEDDYIPLGEIIARYSTSKAIIPDLPIEEPDNSLSMGDEHLSTILATKSDEVIKSSVENLVPIPSESADLSDEERECDMPVCDDFTTFSNPLFDSDNDFSSNDDESFSDEDVPNENFKIYSNPLFDDEIISSKIEPHHFNAESDLIESLLNRDISTVTNPKIDSLLEEFSGKLAHIDLIPPRINVGPYKQDLNEP